MIDAGLSELIFVTFNMSGLEKNKQSYWITKAG